MLAYIRIPWRMLVLLPGCVVLQATILMYALPEYPSKNDCLLSPCISGLFSEVLGLHILSHCPQKICVLGSVSKQI